MKKNKKMKAFKPKPRDADTPRDDVPPRSNDAPPTKDAPPSGDGGGLVQAAIGGAVVGVLALCLLEALVAMIGGAILLMLKSDQIKAANFVASCVKWRLHPTTEWIVGVSIVLSTLAGAAGGVWRLKVRPDSAGWFLPWLKSIGLGVTFLVALAIVSITGTIFDLKDALVLVFDTWWFRVLLFVLACNIGLATWEHLRRSVLPNLAPKVNPTPAVYHKARLKRRVAYRGPAERLETVLRRHRYRAVRDGEFLAGRKGLLRRFGAPISHVGFISVLLCGFLTGLVGHEGFLPIIEGGTATEYWSSELSAKQQNVVVNAIVQGVRPEGIEPLPMDFSIRCLDFDTGVHAKTNIPSKYTSTVEVTDGDERFVDFIEVNHSLTRDGLTFHQNSYNALNHIRRYRLLLTDRRTNAALRVELDPNGGDWPLSAGAGAEPDGAVRLKQDRSGLYYERDRDGQTVARQYLARRSASSTTHPLQLKATRFVPDFVMGGGAGDDMDQRVFSKSEEPNNPALRLALFAGNEEIHHEWRFSQPRFRDFAHAPHKEFNFVFERYAVDADGKGRFTIAVSDRQTEERLATHVLWLNRPVALIGAGGQAVTHAAAAKAEELEDAAYTAKYLGPTTGHYTMLSVTCNPLIPLIYLGCGMMCLGLIFAFYFPQRGILLWHRPEEGEVLAVAVYRGDQPELTQDVERLFRALERASD